MSFLLAAALLAVSGPKNLPAAVRCVGPDRPDLAGRVAPFGVLLRRDGDRMFEVLPNKGVTAARAATKLRALGYKTSIVRAKVVPLPENSRPEYTRGYWQRVKERAYPFALPDANQVARARAHRDRMTAYEAPGHARNDINGNWQFLGPVSLPVPYRQYFGEGFISGRVNGAAFHPTNSSILYLASAGGGAWKSINGGATWQFLSQSWPDLHTSSVAIDPNNPDTVYVGTGDFPGDQRGAEGTGVLSGGYGLMKTIDGGINWTVKTAPMIGNRAISAIWVDPNDSRNIVITAGNQSGGVFRSTDGGDTWSQRVGFGAIYSNLSYGPNRPGLNRGYLYTASPSVDSTPSFLLRSADGGATWTILNRPSSVTQMAPVLVAASKIQPDTVYAMYPTDRRVYKSTNAGSSWTAVSNGIPTGDWEWDQQGYNFALETSWRQDGQSRVDVVYMSQKDIYRSYDGGSNWNSLANTGSVIASRIHSDQHAIAINPSNPDQALFGGDGGIFSFDRTTDRTTSLNRYLSITQFYDADWSDTNIADAIGGTQDNATAWLDNGTWRNVIGGDGGGAWIDPRNRAVMFGSTQGPDIAKTDTTWTFSGNIGIPYLPGEQRKFTSLLAPDPNNPDLLYTAGQNVYQIDNVLLGGARRLNGPNSPRYIRTLSVAKGDSNRIYAGTFGQLFMTTDRGTTWTDIAIGSPSLPNRCVISVNSAPGAPNDVLVTLGGSGGDHVFRCQNVTANPRIWRNVSGGTLAPNTRLPDIMTSDIARDTRDPANIWYVGTDVGVFVTLNAGDDWYNATGPLQLANVAVTKMETVPATSFLNIATFGRGMWRLPLTTAAQTISAVTTPLSARYAGTIFPVTVTLGRTASHPYQDVDLYYSGPVRGPARVRVSGLQRTATVNVQANAVSVATAATVTAGIGQSTKVLSVQIRPPRISTIEFLSRFVYGGEAIRARVALEGVPDNDYVVQLSTPTKGVKMPSSLTFIKGQQTVEFTIQPPTTNQDFELVLKAVGPFNVAYGRMTVRAPQVSSLSTDRSRYAVQQSGELTVSLTSFAPVGGTKVVLSTSPLEATNMPTQVVVPEGSRSVTIKFVPVRNGTVTVSATAGTDVKTAKFLVGQ